MSKPREHKLYEPKIPRERDVIQAKLNILAEIMGTKRCIRHGEQYICTCECGSVLVTSDEVQASSFVTHMAICDEKE